MQPCICRASRLTLRRRFSTHARKSCYSTLTRKSYYSTLPARTEVVSVPCRSNGFITLRIHHPLRRSEPNSPVIIYLPPGPVLPVALPASDVASELCSATSAVVVQVDYRLSSEHKFPTCVHDVLRAYDWVVEHLVPGRAFHRPGRDNRHATPIAACGELVGGGLATMLALTECRMTGPRVAAVAANEPMVDWVFPQEHVMEDDDDAIDYEPGSGVKPVSRQSKKKRQKIVPSFHAFGNNGILDADTLLSARSTYFRKPEDFFDPFASPALFFRTAGVAIPRPAATPMLDDFAELAKFEREDFHRQQLKLSNIGITTDPLDRVEADEAADNSKPPRMTYKRWPSVSSGLMLPDMRISFGDSSPLSDQAVELAMLVRRSIIAQNRKQAVDEEQADRNREEAFTLAEQKIQLQATEGIRFWGSQQHSGLGRVAQWLRQVFG